MRIALIADTFPPLRTSGAVQLRDLSREFERQGHDLTVILPAPEQGEPWTLSRVGSIHVLRLKCPRTKDVNYVRRTLGEFAMPFAMLRGLRKSPLAGQKWDGVVWYAPSIFHGPLAKAIKTASGCKGYLIIRDIFPEWAVDMGLMGRGLPYRFFDAVARYQYSVADVIGVQSKGNSGYFEKWRQGAGRSLEVLPNWLGDPGTARCPIRIAETQLAGRKVLVYAGNMGVAQGMGTLLELAVKLRQRKDVGFVFVGRGSDVQFLKESAKSRRMENVLFFDEIEPEQIPDLCAQCAIGLVALDPRHKSHNIPGKFLTYMQSGLPVLATTNPGNDLCGFIRGADVGEVCEGDDVATLADLAIRLLDRIERGEDLSARCIQLYEQAFSVEATARQIAQALGVKQQGTGENQDEVKAKER